ncbi:anti-sigma factor [Kocuria sp. CNJ-770]|uniref:anti-sigma factor n=1 Tax=Kocuria sp. CNJ-770 TaxID=1904964 RepID=UPI0009FA8E47|nr:anti-sigma factor [Kocuria sp. CNJ-770]
MAHLSEESLVLLALGEAGDLQVQEHLAGCRECATELESLGHVVRVARADPPAPAAPGRRSGPPSMPSWASPTRSRRIRSPGPRTAAGCATGTTPQAAGTPVRRRRRARGGATVVDLADRRRRGVPYPLAAAAAAAALLVGGLSVWGAQRLGLEPEPTVLATAELEPLAGYTARGSAEVDELPDGTRQLVVRTDPADVDGFKEVWLLAPDAQRMVSLGVMAGDEAVFVLPANLDVGEFPVVDVSNEPIDGDPTHSGDSIVRGALQA